MKLDKPIITPVEVESESNFGLFYNSYYQRFVRYAYYYLNDREAAEDITHDSILGYWENRAKIAAETDVLGYILMAVRNKCLNYLKHMQVEAEHAKKCADLYEWEIKARIMVLEETNYSDIFMKEIMEMMTASLSKLAPQTRFIFVQNRLKYKSRKEIAAELGVSLQKIDYHINKANAHLYKDLKEYFPLIFILIEKIV